tara:strand:+ start:12 stop:782 length:771 start_codon:yes stop_codon:yes gene_type:complete
MNIKFLSKIYNKFFKEIFKFEIIIVIVSYIRFLYFVKILGKFKTYYSTDHKSDGIAHNEKETAIESNIYHLTKKLNFIQTFQKFSGSRTQLCLNPINSLDFINYSESKVLAIGPRLEGEIFKIVSNGFRFKNISAIDLQSYSPLIDLGDMTDMKYNENSFDIVLCSFVLNYSNNVSKAAKEMIRVAKNGSIISISLSIKPDIQLSKEDLTSSSKVLEYFKENIDSVMFNFHPLNKKNNYEKKIKSFRSILTFQIKK